MIHLSKSVLFVHVWSARTHMFFSLTAQSSEDPLETQERGDVTPARYVLAHLLGNPYSVTKSVE